MMKLNRKKLRERRRERERVDDELLRNVVYVHRVDDKQICIVAYGWGFRRRFCIMEVGRRGYLVPKSRHPYVMYHSAVEDLLKMIGCDPRSISAMKVGED